jgi:hypothetical protein
MQGARMASLSQLSRTYAISVVTKKYALPGVKNGKQH